MRRAILGTISAIALIEFVMGAVLIEGGSFGLGIVAMIMPLAWFGVTLIRNR